MPRRQFSDGQELVNGDFKLISAALEEELYDRVVYELLSRKTNICFGDSFSVSRTNGTTVTVKAGQGFQNDNTQVDPEPQNRLLYLPTDTAKTLAAADPTNPRIDLVCIAWGRATSATSTRKFKDATSGAISNVSMIVEDDWVATLSIVTGTPAGSPVAPATPAGTLKIAELLVNAVTGVPVSGGITDKRTIFLPGGSGAAYVTKAIDYQVALSDEVVYLDGTSGSITATLPLAATVPGKVYRFKRIDSVVGNSVTVSRAGTDLIDGASTQTLDAQYSSISMHSNGTGWALL